MWPRGRLGPPHAARLPSPALGWCIEAEHWRQDRASPTSNTDLLSPKTVHWKGELQSPQTLRCPTGSGQIQDEALGEPLPEPPPDVPAIGPFPLQTHSDCNCLCSPVTQRR